MHSSGSSGSSGSSDSSGIVVRRALESGGLAARETDHDPRDLSTHNLIESAASRNGFLKSVLFR